jgi:hypothetical protein
MQEQLLQIPQLDCFTEGKTVLPAQVIINKMGSSVIIDFRLAINSKVKPKEGDLT